MSNDIEGNQCEHGSFLQQYSSVFKYNQAILWVDSCLYEYNNNVHLEAILRPEIVRMKPELF